MRRQFYVLKASLEQAVRDAEAGEFERFDPQAFEPTASTKQKRMRKSPSASRSRGRIARRRNLD